MYCKKCGKEVEDGKMLCADCEASDLFDVAAENEAMRETVAVAKVEDSVETNAAKPSNGDRKRGLGFGITAAVLGAIALAIASAAFGWLVGALEMMILVEDFEELYNFYNAEGTTSIVGAVFSVLFAIPAFIFGIISIVTFKKAKKEGGAKPIATLICGIAGMVQAGSAIVYTLMCIAFVIILMLL